MAHLLRMPSVLAGASEAVLLAWTVEVGDSFAEGDSIAEIETDKALVELAAEESAILGRTLVSGGTKVTVGDPIAVLAASTDSDDDIDAVAAEAGGASSEVDVAALPDPEPDPAAIDTAPEASPSPENGRLFVSPLVRRLAREQGIDPAVIPGTGPGGRIVRRDLEAWLASEPTTPEPAAPEPAATAPCGECSRVRGHPALGHAARHRPAPDREQVDGPALLRRRRPARGPAPRAARGGQRDQRHPRLGQRPPGQGHRHRVPARPRGQRHLDRRRAAPLTTRSTSRSPSTPRRASSHRSCGTSPPSR